MHAIHHGSSLPAPPKKFPLQVANNSSLFKVDFHSWPSQYFHPFIFSGQLTFCFCLSSNKTSLKSLRLRKLLDYRVAGLSCPEAGGCKSAILRGFPNVFSLFGPCKVGAISFRYSWTTGMKKKFRNLVLKKGQISGFAQIDIFLISNFFGYLSITFFKVIQM